LVKNAMKYIFECKIIEKYIFINKKYVILIFTKPRFDL